MSEADVVYRIVKDHGERGITLAEIKAQAEGIHAHSALTQLVVAKYIKTVVSQKRLHYATNESN